MKDKFTVTLVPEDTVNTFYSSVDDCPLCRAIKKEQGAKSVIIWGSSVSIAMIDNVRYNMKNWNLQIYTALKNSMIPEVIVTFTLQK